MMDATRNLLHCLTALAGLFLVYWYGFSEHVYGNSDRWLQVFALIGLFRLNGLTGPWAKANGGDSWWYAGGLFAVIGGLVLNYYNLKEGYMLMMAGALVILFRQIIEWFQYPAHRAIRSVMLLIYLSGIIYILQYRSWLDLPFHSSYTLILLNLMIFLTLLGGGLYGLVKKPMRSAELSDQAIDYPTAEDE